MKKLITLIVLVSSFSTSLLSQNVGIGTTSPTNTLHIVPATNPTNPLRIEGLQIYTNENSVFAVDPNTGIVKYMPINAILSNVDSAYLDSTILSTVINNFDTIFGLMRDSLLLDSTFINTLRDSVDSDIDSMRFVNDTLYLYEDNQVLTSYINASTDTNLVDSLILANSDTLYTITRDSLLNDSLFLNSLTSILGDSIDTDIDSMILIGDTLHIYEDAINVKADISSILDSIKTRDSLFTPDYVIFADSNGRLSEDTTLHFKTVINAKGDRTILLNTDTIVNTGNSAWSQFQVYKKETNYEGVVSLEDGYVGISMAGSADPVIHFENRSGSFNNTQPLDTSIDGNRATGTLVFLGKDSTTTRGTQATIQGTSKSYDNQRLLTGFLFTGRTTATPANPKGTYGYNFPHYHNNSELLLELNNDGNGSMQAHFYTDSRNDSTQVNNFLYTDANGVFQSKSIDTLIQLMRDSIDDADWKINANTTGLEAAAAGDNLASGTYAIAAGQSDTATGYASVISGGRQNKTTGSYSSVTGGYQNLAQGSYSTVGGYNDTALASYSGVLSGRNNKIENSGSYSVIPGGYGNKITGSSSHTSVSGYNNYTNYARYSFIYGENDTIMRNIESSFIAGYNNGVITESPALTGWNYIIGKDNKIRIHAGAANNSHTYMILGFSNEIIGYPGRGACILGGGQHKIADSTTLGGYKSIVGGWRGVIMNTSGTNNTAPIIVGGQSDTIDGSGNSAIVGGGLNRISRGLRNGILGGLRNKISSSSRASIIGGNFNTIISGNNQSVIIGGDTNIIRSGADDAVIIGGRKNTANNFAQVVLGHYSTNNVPTGSSAGSVDPDNILLKIGNGTGPSALNDAMVVKANGNVGIGVFNPTNQLHIAGGTDPLRLEGIQNGGSTDSVLVTDGTGVVKRASLNSITRVCGGYTFTNLEGGTVVSHGLFCTFTTPTYTLPAANTTTGRKFVIKLETNPAISATVTAVSGNIDGAASYDMLADGKSSVILQSDGSNYWIIGSH